MCFNSKSFLFVVVCLVLAACQGEQDMGGVAPTQSKPKTNIVKPAPEQVASPAEKKKISVELQPEADLKLTDEFRKKIAEKEEDYLAVPPAGEKAAESPRKIKLSGKVILDEEEKELTKKVDGGEIEISIPLD